jgi:hypothetical protein
VPLTVPWTIANRYYVADVHFSAWTVDRMFVEVFERQPPAVVFVWSEGQVGFGGFFVRIDMSSDVYWRRRM